MKDKTTRRKFLGLSAAAAAGLAGSSRLAAGGRREPGPNDTIRLGLIGCGARGRTRFIPEFSKYPGSRIVALCDVNAKRLAECRKLAGGERISAYHDYRKLLEDKDIDAVIIASNQQWHVLQMIAACQAGKDVYMEKPLGQSIAEGPVAIEAARKYGRIVQAGTQQRSQQHYQKAVEVIQSGALGEISEVRVWDYENYWPGAGFPADCEPPQELDWDFYVGPSSYRNYNPNIYDNYGYDWFKVAGAGHQVAWGVHHFDVVLWAMGVRWPETAYASGGNFAFEDNHEWPNTFSATLEFGPGPVAKHGFVLQYTMRTGCRREALSHGKSFMGSEASMLLDRSGYSIVKEAKRGERVTPAGRLIGAEETVQQAGDGNYHFELFLENLRRRSQPTATPETCHYASAIGHLMNISWEAGRSIRWDGERNQVVGDPEANALVMKPYRAPWKLEV